MFDVQTSETGAIVHVNGEVDLACRDEFASTLERATGGVADRLVVSLVNCDYIDSTGIGVLVRARKVGRCLNVVVPAESRIERIFSILQLTEYLGLVPTLEAAFGKAAIAA